MTESPFHGTGTSLTIPKRISPGVPFYCEVRATNTSPQDIFENRLRVIFPEGVSFIDGSLSINRRRITTVANIERELRLNLPPRKTGERHIVTFEAVLDNPALDCLTLVAELLTPPDIAYRLEGSALVSSAVEFTAKTTRFQIAGDLDVHARDERDIRAIIVNEGTAVASNATLEWGAADVAGLAPSALGDLSPGDVRYVDGHFSVSGSSPTLAPRVRYDGGHFDLEPLSLRFHAPIIPSAEELVSEADALFALDGTPVDRRLDEALLQRIEELAPHVAEQLSAAVRARAVPNAARRAFVPYRMDVASERTGAVGMGEALRVGFEVFHDDRAIAESVTLSFRLGPELQLAGTSVLINGSALSVPTFDLSPTLTLRGIQPGALIRVEFDVRAQAATLQGTRTSIQGLVSWDDQSACAALVPFAVEPRVIVGQDTLPFEVVLDSAAPTAEQATAVAPEPETAVVVQLQAPASQQVVAQSAETVAPAAPVSEAAVPLQVTPPLQVAPPLQESAELAPLDTPQPEPAASDGPAVAEESPAAELPREPETGPEFAVAAFDEGDINRITGRISGVLRAQADVSLTAALVILGDLIPLRIQTDDLALAQAYAAGVEALGSCSRKAHLRFLSADEGAPMAYTAQEVQQMHDRLRVFASLCRDRTVGFRSAQNGDPSFAASAAAFATLAGTQFEEGTEIAAAAEEYGSAIIDALAALDDRSDLTIAGDLCAAAPETLRELGVSCHAALSALAMATVA